jgi:endonuclease/exonuclease/phosphatase family metal-dependent hydrolase
VAGLDDRRPTPSPMRIGTWNLEGRRDGRQAQFLLAQDCDVWLLTEVSESFSLAGFALHTTSTEMAPGRRWAAVASRQPLEALPDPHPASAMAAVGDLTFCSSVLPWRSCGARSPWVGTRHGEKTKAVMDALALALPLSGLVWGGDLNQSLDGPDYSGSRQGLGHILAALDRLGLQVPTRGLPHREAAICSIDHIAVASGLQVTANRRVAATVGGERLSDHDLYWVEIP